VVRFYGVSQWGDLLNLVVEYVPDGSLDEYLREHIDELPLNVLIDMCKNVASGIPRSLSLSLPPSLSPHDTTLPSHLIPSPRGGGGDHCRQV
jgi:serine/threonine protein kinase